MIEKNLLDFLPESVRLDQTDSDPTPTPVAKLAPDNPNPLAGTVFADECLPGNSWD
ncbi:MAG: hypothetical protein HY978_01185 [Candidatus Liptonbacteria bacterium]|nr:hypothetical protein [Candidatus Liptonbacteria bacterium]